MSSCDSWDISFSDKTFLAFFLAFLCCALLSSTANGILFFLTVRYKQLLWQPQYIMIKNISACGIGMSFVTTLVILSSLARQQPQSYGWWCIGQFCILRCFFFTSQMTLALMAIERYIFICHAIHYFRVINTCKVYFSIGLIWMVSLAGSFHGGLVLSQIQCDFNKQTSGLLCDAFTIKEHITFSQEEFMLVFGLAGGITAFCILIICYCYGRMYHSALRVSMALKCKNHRVNRTVGFYLLMFLLQLILNILYIVLTIMGKRKAFYCSMISSMVTPLLIIIPPLLIAAFLLIRNPQIKHLLFSAYHQNRRSTIVSEFRGIQRSNGSDEIEEHCCHSEQKRQLEMEDKGTIPLPGSAFSSTSEEF